MTAAPIGVYVHIPFCLSRCAYCSFVSNIYDAGKVDDYLDALQKEIRYKHEVFASRPLSTLFIGGGTPSCLDKHQMRRLLSLLPTVAGEATCEVNPDSVTSDVLALLRDFGVNRISIGIQTFSEQGLRVLGRRHIAVRAAAAVEKAHSFGLPSINVDIINGWPGQTPDILKQDLESAINLGVHHISCYNLIVEESASGYTALSLLLHSEEEEEERARALWDVTETVLQDAGFHHYETSNFARPGKECQHNLDIWKGGEYAGLGVAAHSSLKGRRFANTSDLDCYIRHAPDPMKIEQFSEELPREQAARECAVFWLRLYEGIHLQDFASRTGFEFLDLYSREVPGFLHNGIMEYNHQRTHIRVTAQYQPVLDSILVDLI